MAPNPDPAPVVSGIVRDRPATPCPGLSRIFPPRRRRGSVVAWRAGEKRLESRSNLQFSSSPLRFFAPLREALWSPHSALRAPNFLSNHPSQFQTNSNQFKVIQTKSNHFFYGPDSTTPINVHFSDTLRALYFLRAASTVRCDAFAPGDPHRGLRARPRQNHKPARQTPASAADTRHATPARSVGRVPAG